MRTVGFDPRKAGVDAVTVEAEAIDDSVGFRYAEQAWRGIARLWQGCDAAEFGKTKTEAEDARYSIDVFVKTGGKADGIKEIQLPCFGA